MKILYYIYQICFALPILLVLTILTALVTIVGSLIGGAHIWGYYPGKIWSQLICVFLLIPVKVRGREKIHKHTSYVFVPNHQGAFDIFLIYGFLGRNFKWMMKKSLRKLPFVGKACESAGHIFVDRSGPKKVLETIRQAKASLKDGVSLVVFPEGARTFTGHMGYFKKGAFQLADELQLEVVPVTIDGSFQILPRTGKWIHRHRMILTIHDPIPPKGQGIENIKATMAEAYAALYPVDVNRIQRPRQPFLPLFKFLRRVIKLRKSGVLLPRVPEVNAELCTHCGVCAVHCPSGAILKGDECNTIAEKCIKCCACVKGCSFKARTYDTPFASLLSDYFVRQKEDRIIL